MDTRDTQLESGSMPTWIYNFGEGMADGGIRLRHLLGTKGANLAEMASLGLPVPPGFTITTEVCRHYYANDRRYPADLERQVNTAIDILSRRTGRSFSHPERPLLVSVRSGALAAMPGMMDTVLNLGLNDITVEALAAEFGDARFALDSYRRFIQMFGDVVMGVDGQAFEEILDDLKEREGYFNDTELTADEWRKVIASFKDLVVDETGKPFPLDPLEQLWGAIGAVLGSWSNSRAVTFRKLHGISSNSGTAVNVQAMVFGNMDERSATGVAFTRNPSTGERQLYGEFLLNAQGEEVVAGLRTPQDITEAARLDSRSDRPSLEALMPETYREFIDYCQKLERHFKDIQDLEFTIERGKLWMLQTRSGRRTVEAALKIAVDMANEGLITREEAIERIDPSSLEQLLHPTIEADAPRDILATGLPASPGAAVGEIAFNSEQAEKARQRGIKVILVRAETSPDDVHGMHSAVGVVTARGGMTSHAAVIARGLGKPCVVGVSALKADPVAGTVTIGKRELKAGDLITIDGSSGQIMAGRVPMKEPELSGPFAEIMIWADTIRRLEVRANAETPTEARIARQFGAEGIGLCRTEHMFFEHSRISAVREMILAETPESRRAALEKILPMQRQDFAELFEIMEGRPVCIRLLDPPLHEFLPRTEKEVVELARTANVAPDVLRRRIANLEEYNPMLGHRGCRLAISFPEIAEVQARAIFEAAIAATTKIGRPVVPEIMVPLVAARKELDYVKAIIARVAIEVSEAAGQPVNYKVGTMIELPRAALMAEDIAQSAAFFSFGTNDLTQTTFGISRDDAASFLPTYLQKGVLARDPFVSIDRDGVGELIRIAIERGRKSRPDIGLGMCGEHGGDPASIAFCEEAGLAYVSCSPFRLPIARLAAARAVVLGRKERLNT